jgi:hypothetical protein
MIILGEPSGQSPQASSCDDQEETADKSRVRELMREVRTAAETAVRLARRSNDALYQGLVDAGRLAELVQRDDEAWRIFVSHSYFRTPPPRTDALSAVVRYMFDVTSYDERQKASLYTNGLRFFLEVRGVPLEDLLEAIKKAGGLSRAVRLYSEYRRRQKASTRPTYKETIVNKVRSREDPDLLTIPVRASLAQRDRLLEQAMQPGITACLLHTVLRDGEIRILSVLFRPTIEVFQ